ncbi:MAG TPA: inorganic diphosphatase [Bacteroidales bacterium]|jgi:inorganic pyrophosphatase|nr:inorganic diphosphatase [Bacteroidales bacterium]MCZ2417186.1 inorganic diphosphatase [Burkholderiales bacterium]OQC55873.1 MAG: Inorganic pyrophosphatase [Bacteroidetes bacterium ADurb.Bin013]MBV6455622.1 Inorganic pyrophosphatase [Bacteroidales bacterium]HNR27190.1 inorganic diphosphatase [Bacteroidales bacterium]
MMVHNPWHSVEPEAKGFEVNALIEISNGSRAKYELDKETGLLKLDRVLYSAVYYPANYGFIPRTYAKDDDPLDVLVLSQIAIQPLCIVRVKIIGVMQMIDQGKPDDKLISVACHDKSVSHIEEIKGMPPIFDSELKQFFEEYKRLEQKTVLVEEFADRKKALDILEDALQRYKELYP